MMMEYLQLSGLKCLNFQANNKKNRKSKTYAAFLNFPLPLAADSPRPILNISSIKQQLIVYRLIGCLCHPPFQNITHCGSEHMDWTGWWLVWYSLTMFGRSNKLCSDIDVYFIVLGGRV